MSPKFFFLYNQIFCFQYHPFQAYLVSKKYICIQYTYMREKIHPFLLICMPKFITVSFIPPTVLYYFQHFLQTLCLLLDFWRFDGGLISRVDGILDVNSVEHRVQEQIDYIHLAQSTDTDRLYTLSTECRHR